MSNSVRRSVVVGVLCLAVGAVLGHQWPGAGPTRQAQASEAPKPDLQLTGSIGGFWLFDRASGDVWVYKYAEEGKTYQPLYVGKIKEPGKPPEKP